LSQFFGFAYPGKNILTNKEETSRTSGGDILQSIRSIINPIRYEKSIHEENPALAVAFTDGGFQLLNQGRPLI